MSYKTCCYQLSPLFEDSQVPEESELVEFLANKAPKSHKAVLINQGFNPEASTLVTFVEDCEHAETTDDIAGRSSLPLTRKASLGRKSAPRPRVIVVRNASSVLPRCIAISMDRIQATIQRIATLSRLKVRPNLSSPRRTSRKRPGN